MASVTLIGVRKIYAGAARQRVAVDGLDLAVGDGEFVVLVGPSGCGKSTTLRMVAGLESVSGGELKIGDRVVNDVGAKDRNVAMVFQNYALYPHMTAYENMAFNLKLRHTPPADIERRVREAAAILRITGLLERRPRQLSGGEQQRVAIAAVAARRPSIVFADEPTGELDAANEAIVLEVLHKLRDDYGAAVIIVTHSQTVAGSCDRVVEVSDGRAL
jgi:ABC-type sugar transport system ATPase subunit